MAEGIAERFGTDCAIALSGIAGPGGGTPEKPVGLVYCGIVCEGVTEVFEFRLGRSREQIRERAAAKALDMLRRMLLKGAE
ncbi:MAG: CinA family protein, partial [Lentisphaeria bacterium]|nr:CinA family protein [Lentisphaeria bacterium]